MQPNSILSAGLQRSIEKTRFLKIGFNYVMELMRGLICPIAKNRYLW